MRWDGFDGEQYERDMYDYFYYKEDSEEKIKMIIKCIEKLNFAKEINHKLVDIKKGVIEIKF